MPKRHRPSTQALPRIWLMTDERLGAGLIDAVRALPKGSGIIFRHYATGDVARRDLFRAVRRLARKNRHMLLLADTAQHARAWGCYKLALSSNRRRERAHAFYESLGFERHGVSFVIDPQSP